MSNVMGSSLADHSRISESLELSGFPGRLGLPIESIRPLVLCLSSAGSLKAHTHPHPDHKRSFERAKANQLWQTDLFTFILKRQNRRVYLVAFIDDHSRFIVSYGLHASQSTPLVLEVLRAGIANHGTPEEILTDNGSQYITWRGKSAFTKELEKRGVKQIVARPRRPQTLGKIERFLGQAGGNASRRPFSATWATRRRGSVFSSTTTTFSGSTAGSEGWSQPTGFSGRRRKS